MSAVTKWTFFDPVASATLTWEFNPAEGGDHDLDHETAVLATTTSHEPVIMESGLGERTVDFTGTLLSVGQRDTLLEWVNKERPILWTNDLGETEWIYIDEFTPKRKRRVSHPYIADYTIHARILEDV